VEKGMWSSPYIVEYPSRADSYFQQEKMRLAQEVVLMRSQHDMTAVGGKVETKKPKKYGTGTNKRGKSRLKLK
jgi:hypothetical protein